MKWNFKTNSPGRARQILLGLVREFTQCRRQPAAERAPRPQRDMGVRKAGERCRRLKLAIDCWPLVPNFDQTEPRHLVSAGGAGSISVISSPPSISKVTSTAGSRRGSFIGAQAGASQSETIARHVRSVDPNR